MSQVPGTCRYTKDHEWAKVEANTAVIGITDHAQSELGDIVFVELPKVGSQVKQGESFGTVEAVKTVAELYSPLTGEIVEVNSALADKAEVINSDPYGEGWIIKVKIADNSEVDQLMSAEAYQSFVH